MEKQYIRFSMQGHILVVSKQTKVPTVFKSVKGRGQINGFSVSSGCRMRRYLRCCVADYKNMVTLTYPNAYPEDGVVFKGHLRRFVQELKRQTSRDIYCNPNALVSDYSVFWFMEFQERGAPHFHLFTTHNYDKEWIARKWYEIVDSEDDRHLRAGTRIEALRSGRRGTCSYAAKYAAKTSQKVPPEWVQNAGRFWGVSGNRKCVVADTLIPLSACKAPGVRSSMQNVKNFLEAHVSAGKIKKITKESTLVYFFPSDLVIHELVTLIKRMQLQAIKDCIPWIMNNPASYEEEINADHMPI